MKKFIFGMFIVILVSAGCTEAQKQQVTSIFSANTYNNVNQTIQQAAAVSSAQVAAMEGDTPLILASRRGDLKAVQTLLAGGADVNAANEKGFTSLMAASQEGHVEVIKALSANKKLDLEAMNWNMDTALMLAVQNNQLEAVKALLAIGAQPNYAKAGMTVLIAASYKGNPDIVRALLEAGADASVVDENNESALDVALNTNKPAVAAVLREYQNKKR